MRIALICVALTQRALGMLTQRPECKSFMKNHSDLAGSFNLPGSGGYSSPKALAGLHTRSGVLIASAA
jgi:hypothetical protein